MGKLIKVVLIGFIVLVLVPAITLFVFSKLHDRSIRNELTDIIKEQISAKVEFEEFNFSYLRSFPKVHAEFINMTIHDSNDGRSTIGDLDVLLDFSELVQRKILIERLVISDAHFVSEIDSLGNKPRIFSGSGNSEKGQGEHSIVIKSHDIEIFNSHVYLGNRVKGNKIIINVLEGKFSLSVMDSVTLVYGDAKARLDTLIANDNLLLTNQPATVKEVVFSVDTKTGLKKLEKGFVLAHTLKLVPKIKMTPTEEGQEIELQIFSEGNFDTFLELVDFHFDFDLAQINPDAKLEILYKQQGLITPFLRPYSEIDFKIENAEFTGSKLPYPIKNFYFSGNFNNGASHSPETSVLVIDTLHAEVSDSYINGRCQLSNLNDPVVDAHFRSNLNLGHLIAPNENFDLTGIVEADLIVDGKISELKKIHLEEKQHATGVFNVKDLNLFLKKSGYKIYLENGSTVLNNHMFEVTTLIGELNESAFHFNGVFDNLDQYLSEKDQELLGEINLNFGKIDLNSFNVERSSDQADASSSSLNLPMISLNVSVHGDRVVGNFGELKDFRMESRINPNDIRIEKLRFQYQEGEVAANGGIFLIDGQVDSVNANISGNFHHLDLVFQRDTLQPKEKTPSLSLPNFIYADIHLAVDEGELFSVPLKNLRLDTQIKGSEISIPDFSFDAFGGSSHLSAHMVFDEKEIVEITANSKLNFDYLDLGKYMVSQEKTEEDSTIFTLAELPKKMDVKFSADVNELVYKDQIIKDFESDIDVDTNIINVSELSATLPFGSVEMGLKVDGIRDEYPAYTGFVDLKIDTLFLDRLLNSEALGLPNRKTGNNENSPIQTKRIFVPNTRMKIKTRADRIYYQNARIDNAAFDVAYSSEKLEFQKLDFYFADGHVSTNGYVLNSKSEKYGAYIQSTVDSISIEKVLLAFNNFNQDVFNSENSRGNLSWESQLFLQLDQSFFPITKDNLWKFEISVHNGEFRKIEPIEQALFFVGHQAKDDLIVSELDINAYLHDGKILFKDVFVNDNIADLDLFGEIDIADSIIDIGMEISLTDLLLRSKKKRVIETEEGESHLDSDMKIFLKMEGPISEHKLKTSSARRFKSSRKDLDKVIDQAEETLKSKVISH